MERPAEQGIIRPGKPQEELLTLVRALHARVVAAQLGEAQGSSFCLRGGAASSASAERRQRETDTQPPSGRTSPAPPAGKLESGTEPVLTLADVRAMLGDCRRCPLSATRKNIVFGEGNPQARIVFVGEAPGADEDRLGRPFVGRAGQLLNRIIAAMGLSRNDVYICNINKCRPPGNRNPLPAEIVACEPFLIRQLAAIAPEVICALGMIAAQTLLKTDVPIAILRGRFHSYQGIPVMPTYHPAYLLRNPEAKKHVWDDMQMVMKKLGLKP